MSVGFIACIIKQISWLFTFKAYEILLQALYLSLHSKSKAGSELTRSYCKSEINYHNV